MRSVKFISTKGDAAYAVIELTVTDDQSVALVDGIRAKLAPPAGIAVQLTGYGPITEDSAKLSEKDLQRAETVSFPILAIILILVFASLVAAFMPLVVAVHGVANGCGLIMRSARWPTNSTYRSEKLYSLMTK